MDYLGKVISLLFNMLPRLVITFLPRSKCLLISWLQSPSAVILEPKKIKSDTVSTVCPSISHEVMGPDAMILVFWMLSFRPTFSLSFTFIKRLTFCKPSINSVVLCLTLQPHGLWLAKLCPWNSPEKNTGVGSHFLLQGIFPTQGSNLLRLLHWQAGSLSSEPPGKPINSGKEVNWNTRVIKAWDKGYRGLFYAKGIIVGP